MEAIIRDHPDVLDVAVIGVDDNNSGQVPKAFVVKCPTSKEFTEKSLQDYVAAKVSPFKKLEGGVVFINSIPKTPSGKILRRELKNL